MSDLTAFRDHCAAMATAEHKPECKWPNLAAVEAKNRLQAKFERLFDEPKGTRPRVIHCPGCNPQADRELFARLAAEVDDYLDPHPTLWGES